MQVTFYKPLEQLTKEEFEKHMIELIEKYPGSTRMSLIHYCIGYYEVLTSDMLEVINKLYFDDSKLSQ